MAPADPRDAATDPPTSDRARRTLLEATAEAALPGVALAEVAELPGEGPHLVGSVTTAGGDRFVLKGAPTGGDVAALRREATVTTVVGERTDVPVPVLLDASFEPADAPVPYLLFEWVDGQPLEELVAGAPGPAQLGAFRAVGETLAALHAGPSFEAAGTVTPTGPAALEVEDAGPWPEVFARELADHVNALDGTRFSALAETIWDDVTDRLPALDTGQPAVLLHGDIGDGNVVLDGPEVAAVLDWERAFVGHPEYDLCRAEVRYFWSRWGRRDEGASALYAGYRSRRDLSEGFEARRRAYLATLYLLSLSTFEDWAPRFADDLDAFAAEVAAKVEGVLDAS